MNIIQYLNDNWAVVVGLIGIAGAFAYVVYAFLGEPTDEQIKSVKEWLLYAVTEAEKELGSGTGQLKLRQVYDKFLSRFTSLAMLISFERFSALVDEALIEMKRLISTNHAVKQYVEGDGV